MGVLYSYSYGGDRHEFPRYSGLQQLAKGKGNITRSAYELDCLPRPRPSATPHELESDSTQLP